MYKNGLLGIREHAAEMYYSPLQQYYRRITSEPVRARERVLSRIEVCMQGALCCSLLTRASDVELEACSAELKCESIILIKKKGQLCLKIIIKQISKILNSGTELLRGSYGTCCDYFPSQSKPPVIGDEHPPRQRSPLDPISCPACGLIPTDNSGSRNIRSWHLFCHWYSSSLA